MTVKSKESHARIKINKLLEGAGWRFFDALNGKANILLEPNATRTLLDLDTVAVMCHTRVCLSKLGYLALSASFRRAPMLSRN
jgi:hypothetical protein